MTTDLVMMDIVARALAPYGYKFSDDALDAIFKMSEGRPYYVQLCAYYALEQASEKTILKEDVERGLGSVIMQLALGKYGMQLDTASKNERAVLGIIAKYEPVIHSQIVKKCVSSGIKESTAKTAIKRLLEEKKYIKKRNLKYYIAERMFREFLKTRNHL